MTRQWMWWGAVGLVVALTGCGRSARGAGESAEQAIRLGPGDVAVAASESIGEGVVVSGTLAPYRQADVRAQVPGVLTGLRVDRGSRVTQGEVMARVQAEGVRSQAIGAKAAVAAAQAGLALAARQLASSRKLHAAGALSDIELQQTQAGYEAAQAQLAAANAAEAAAEEAARRATVVAPISGDVSDRKINEGEVVGIGTELLTIVDARYLELDGDVPVEDAAQVRAGMPVEFTLDTYPGKVLRGSVARVEPTADAATRQVGVFVRLPNLDRAIVGGLYATGRILTGRYRQGVVVPSAALRGAGRDIYVWKIRGGKAVQQAVSAGARDERRGIVEILSGVAAGDSVVSAPGDLEDGAAVEIAAPAPAPATGDVGALPSDSTGRRP